MVSGARRSPLSMTLRRTSEDRRLAEVRFSLPLQRRPLIWPPSSPSTPVPAARVISLKWKPDHRIPFRKPRSVLFVLRYDQTPKASGPSPLGCDLCGPCHPRNLSHPVPDLSDLLAAFPQDIAPSVPLAGKRRPDLTFSDTITSKWGG